MCGAGPVEGGGLWPRVWRGASGLAVGLCCQRRLASPRGRSVLVGALERSAPTFFLGGRHLDPQFVTAPSTLPQRPAAAVVVQTGVAGGVASRESRVQGDGGRTPAAL